LVISFVNSVDGNVLSALMKVSVCYKDEYFSRRHLDLFDVFNSYSYISSYSY